MKEKYIALLKTKIEKLDQSDFDLEAWKASVIGTLTGLLGDDPRLHQIENLNIDYSSWALRDATSTYNPRESTKKQGREILNSIIEELEIKGMPTMQTKQLISNTELQDAVDKSNWQQVESILSKMKKSDLATILLKQLQVGRS